MRESARPLTAFESLVQSLPDNPSAFAAAIAGHQDWPALVAAARAHGMLGVIGWMLEPQDVGIPPDIRHQLNRYRAVARVWHAHQMQALEAVLACLQRRSIRVVPLKGPWLAMRYYGEPSNRHAVDLDVLVSPADLDGSVDALTAVGWVVAQGPPAIYARQHHHHLQLTRPGAPPLELHFRARAGFGTVFEAAPLLDRAHEIPRPGGSPITTLAAEDEFIYLAVHAAAHGFVRLMWLYDLKLLRLAHPSLDWNVVAERAARIGAKAPVAFACRLLQERLRMPAPGPRSLVAAGPRHALAAAVQRRVAEDHGPLAIDRLGGLAFTSLLSSTPAAAARLWTHHAMRSLKRRVHRVAPRLVSADWAG